MPRPPAISFTRRLGLAVKAFRAMMWAPHSGAAYSGGMGGGYGYGGGGGVDWLAGVLNASGYGTGGPGPFHRNPTVAACLRVIEDNAPQPVMEVVETQQDGDEVPVKKSPVLDLFRYPNDFYDYYTLAASLYSSLVVDGNAYLIKVRSGAGVPVELWWVPSWMMVPRWPVSDPSIFIDHYEYRPGGGVYYNLDVKDVIHFRYGKIDERNDRLMISPLRAAASRIVCSLNEVDNFTATLMRHGGVPPIVIRPTVGGRPIGPEEAAAMTADYRTLLDGERKGDPFIATGPFEVVPLGFSPEQLALDKIPARLEDQICSLTGVPAMLAGLTSGAQHKTYNNVLESRRSFYEETLIPMQGRVAQAVDVQLLGDPGMGDPKKQRVRFSYAGIRCMEEDADKVATRAQGLWSAGMITRAQAKKLVGIASDANDDLYVVGRGQQFLRVGEEVPPFQAMMPVPGNPNLPPGSGGGVAPPTADGAGSGGGTVPAKALELTLLRADGLPMLTATADELKNCGTGHGGFREGNTCQPHAGGGGGGGGGGGAAPKPAGGGGSGTPTPEQVAALNTQAADLGKPLGQDWSVTTSAPKTPAEQKALDKIQGTGRTLVQTTGTPTQATSKQGDVTTHKVAGDVVAETLPSTAAHDVGYHFTGPGWISRQQSEYVGGQVYEYKYRTQAAAEKSSVKHAAAMVKVNTVTDRAATKNLAGYIADYAKGYPSTVAKGVMAKVVFRLVVPAPAAKSVEGEDGADPFSLKAADAGDDETAIARGLLSEALDGLGLASAYADGSIADDDRHALLAAVSDLAAGRLKQISQDFLDAHPDSTKAFGDGFKAGLADWAGKVRKVIGGALLAGALALFGPKGLPPDEQQALAKANATQQAFFDNFVAEVEDGKQKLDGTFPARAAMYGAVTHQIAENVRHGSVMASGVATEERRVLGAHDDHNCQTCIEQVDLGWQKPGVLLPLGDSICMSRCRCYWETR